MKKTGILRISLFYTILLVLWSPNNTILAQENITFDLKKPKLFENRKLRSETNIDKKLGAVKKIKENIVSHYNFHFNAKNKLNTVLLNAKQSFKDDFDKIIPIDDFSLDQTASLQMELDSVILKCNNGILLHDLRNDWIDDLYFLMGQAYFYEKKFDSAYDVFQYINYTFQPREKGEIGYEKTIGSNINNTGNIYTISSKENTGFVHSFKHEYVRNEALVWIAYSLMEMNNDDEAKSMLDLLSKDNNFPKRLFPLLSEKKAAWFLKKDQYDSAAYHLEKSIPLCISKQEKSRRYFLIAQLYAKENKTDKAFLYFEKSIANTTDPIMEANARIQQIAGMGLEVEESKRIEANIQSLLKLAEKEKYVNFKPIIFSSIATLELKRNNTDAAIAYLQKSNLNNPDEPGLKNKNFLKIAELAYEMKKYALCKSYLDSIDESTLSVRNELMEKKPVITELVANLEIISLEDSLQRLANLSENERMAALSAILKSKRKEVDLEKTEKQTGAVSTQRNNILEPTSGALFPAESQKGEWYFNNPSLVAQGKIEFKNKWGERPNTDNWRRSSSFNAINNPINKEKENLKIIESEALTQEENIISMESLLASLPLTQELIQQSNQKKFDAYETIGNIYKNKLDNCTESIYWNERLIKESSTISNLEQKYFDLSVCHKKEGVPEKSKYYQDLLLKTFPESKLNLFLKDPLALSKIEKEKEVAATNTYEKIYDLLISGKFDEALTLKKEADSVYGETKWTPQLLYLESLYYINKKEDSLAIETLGKITTLYPSSPLSEKATLVSSVLRRRSEIEMELNNKIVVKEQEQSVEWIDDRPLARAKIGEVKLDSMVKDKEPAKVVQPIKLDSSSLITAKKITTSEKYIFDLNESQLVLLILTDVDIIYTNEAKRAIANYNNRSFSNKTLGVLQEKIDEKTILKISAFKSIVEAMDYIDLAKKLGSTEIFPWLPSQKYSFLLISESNYKTLQGENKISPYLEFIRVQLPGKF